MVRERYQLTGEHRNQLEHRTGKSTARVTTRARILLKTEAGWSAPRVAQALDVSGHGVPDQKALPRPVWKELRDRPQAHRYRKLDDRGEAHLIALACSPAPPG